MKLIKGISKRILLEMYVAMQKIRKFEERLVPLLFDKEIKCPVHLCIGQEAVAVGICASLRKEDYILTPDGRRIGRLDHIFKDMVNIKECQIYQEHIERVIFKVVRGKKYTAKDEKMLLREARTRLGNQIEVDIDYVEAIERTKLGKLRFVISKIPTAQIQNHESENS